MLDEASSAQSPKGLTRPVSVRSVPSKGKTIVIDANGPEKVALAEQLDVIAVDSLKAKVIVTPGQGDIINVVGTIVGRVQQTCVVTLEPVEETVNANFAVQLVPDGHAVWQGQKEPVNVLDDDVPDVYHNQMIDVGELVSEHLALELNPYPRSAEASFEPPNKSDEQEIASPFAALKQLKKHV